MKRLSRKKRMQLSRYRKQRTALRKIKSSLIQSKDIIKIGKIGQVEKTKVEMEVNQWQKGKGNLLEALRDQNPRGERERLQR